VRVAGHDPLEVAPRDQLHVRFGQQLEQPLLADASDVVAGVALAVEQDPEIDLGAVQDAGERARDPLGARIEGCVVAHEPENLHRLRARVLDLEAQLAGPVAATAPRPAEGVARALYLRERAGEALVELPVLEQAPAHLVDDRALLDPDRTDLHAGVALHAGPDALRAHGVIADDPRRGILLGCAQQ
jgi:hypothetical protein